MKRREFTRDVQAEIIRRATNAAGQVCCEGCGRAGLKRSQFQVDHKLADALVLQKRKLTAADGQVLGNDCCGSDKTAGDVKIIAKAKAQEAARMGIKAGPAKKIQSRGFAPPAAKPERSDTVKGLPRLPSRSLFRAGR